VKVKLDENIPVSLVEALTSSGHDVQTVIGQGLTGRANYLSEIHACDALIASEGRLV
jgi:hypothetical protein